jgi:hypothetical protein
VAGLTLRAVLLAKLATYFFDRGVMEDEKNNAPDGQQDRLSVKLKERHDDVSKSIGAIILTILSYSGYCLLTLSTSDKTLLEKFSDKPSDIQCGGGYESFCFGRTYASFSSFSLSSLIS